MAELPNVVLRCTHPLLAQTFVIIIEQAGIARAFAAQDADDAERLVTVLRADVYVTCLFFHYDLDGPIEFCLDRIDRILRGNPKCQVIVLTGLDKQKTRELIPLSLPYHVLYMPFPPPAFLDDLRIALAQV